MTAGNPYYDPAKPHHTSEGFRNNYSGPRSGPGYWTWQRERWRKGLPKAPPGGRWPFAIAQPDVAFLKSNHNEPTVTWIGHATLLLQLNGVNVLTDPHFSERASPLSFAGPKRQVTLPARLEDLPRIDLVVVSHNHYDHLDRQTVRRLAAQPGGPPKFLVPLGLKRWLREAGVANATELDWWDKSAEQRLDVHLVPVQHWSGRRLNDRNRTLWGGWVVEAPGFRFFFAGDTGYSPDFRDIAERFEGFHLAAIPIGAYEPRWFMQRHHVNPEEAVRIHQEIRARQSVAIHWGTFALTDEPLDEPPKKLGEALAAARVSPEEFFIMKHGETRHLTRAGTSRGDTNIAASAQSR